MKGRSRIAQAKRDRPKGPPLGEKVLDYQALVALAAASLQKSTACKERADMGGFQQHLAEARRYQERAEACSKTP